MMIKNAPNVKVDGYYERVLPKELRICCNMRISDRPESSLEDLIDKVLSQKESYVIKSKYGIGCEKKSVKDLHNELNVSEEAIRLCCIRAMKHLAADARLRLHHDLCLAA